MTTAVCNDTIIGSMGEKVLWGFLVEQITGAAGVSGSNSAEFLRKINTNYPDTDIIIQNASFMDLVDPSRYTIVYLQDNFRAMGRPSPQQESLLKRANKIVSNSRLTARSYPEYQIEIIPIGVDHTLFYPMDKKDLRISNTLQFEKIGIFVGAFDDVKGWPEIQRIIEKRDDIYWVIVSKDFNGYTRNNAKTFNRIPQELVATYLNCADFFILGSPVETECLAAIEACMCNVPIIMHNTGIFADFSEEDKSKIGYIGQDIEGAIDSVMTGEFQPLEIVLKYHLTIDCMIEKWNELLARVRNND